MRRKEVLYINNLRIITAVTIAHRIQQFFTVFYIQVL